jgi:hypothetical protein
LRRLTATFQDLPLEEIKAFRFQARPYQAVEFRHVALEPGKKAAVEIEEKPAAGAEAPQP